MAQHLDIRYVNFYTAGSSALKVAPAIPLDTISLPKRRKLKRVVLRYDPISVVGILLAAVMLVLMAIGVSELVSLRQNEIQMAAYVDMLQTENQALYTEYEAGVDLQEVEQTALRLGLVPVEEVQRVKLQVAQPADHADKTNGFLGFLTGLFA